MENFSFRQKDLLPLDSFIGYCKDRGINIDKAYLELLHQKGLVYPCAMVQLNVNLNQGGLRYGYEGFLDYYLENGMVKYPVEDKVFMQGNQYGFSIKDFAKGVKDNEKYRILYSKYQFFIIKHIQERGELYTDIFIKTKIIPEYSKFMENLYFIINLKEKFDEEFTLKVEKHVEEALVDIEDIKDKRKDLKSHIKFLKKSMANHYTEIASALKNKINCKLLRKWSEIIMYFGIDSYEDFIDFKNIEMIEPSTQPNKFNCINMVVC